MSQTAAVQTPAVNLPEPSNSVVARGPKRTASVLRLPTHLTEDVEENAAARRRLPPSQQLEYPEERLSTMMIGEILVEKSLVSQTAVDEAVTYGRNTGMLTGQVLLNMGCVTGRQLAMAMAARCGLPFLDADTFTVETDALRLIDPAVAREHFVVPVAFVNEETLIVAVADPTKLAILDSVAALTGLEIQPAVAQENDIYMLIKQLESLQ